MRDRDGPWGRAGTPLLDFLAAGSTYDAAMDGRPGGGVPQLYLDSGIQLCYERLGSACTLA